MKIDRALLFGTALTLPFPLIGLPLTELFTLSAASIFGLCFAIRRMARGVGSRQLAGLLMLAVFAATALPRHELLSFVPSLGALAVAMAPLCFPIMNVTEFESLFKGFLTGLRLTLFFAILTIVLQVTGTDGWLGPLSPILNQPGMGIFLGYNRPNVGFSESSHLAIYLFAAYVTLTIIGRQRPELVRLKLLSFLMVIFSGSLSGIVLLTSYMTFQFLAAARWSSIRRASLRGTLLWGLIIFVCLTLTFAARQSVYDLLSEYLVRIIKAQEDVSSLNLVSSEGSRLNAILALPDYWEQYGSSGFLFGTGYANYQKWLVDTYGYLGELATFGRGQVDNIIVAVFLSTGFCGFSIYVYFIYRAFGRTTFAKFPALVVALLAINFSYGYLISGFYWGLLFLLAAVGRVAAHECQGATSVVPLRRHRFRSLRHHPAKRPAATS